MSYAPAEAGKSTRSATARDLSVRNDHIQQSLLADQRGKWAIKWSFVGLLATASLQAVMANISGNAVIFADTIRNFGDAATVIHYSLRSRLRR